MSNIVIRVQEISKQYELGVAKQRHDTLRDHVAASFKTLFHFNGRRSSANHNETKFWALKDVSFEVKPGEVIGFIGRNGAGKSTLLKILSRITEPTSGSADISGRVASLLEVGTGFHSELTGRENIYLNGSILGIKKAEIDRKFDEIVAFSEIEKFIDTPVKRYSSGMYVRLAFAVAAHLEPEVLIIDEVLAVGDVAFQKKCLGKMKDVSQTGRTVLFVSHNLDAIQRLCSRAILLESGKLAQDGKSGFVIERYISNLDGNSELTGYQELRQTTRRQGNGEIRFASVRIVNMRGETTFTLLHREPFILQLEVESRIETQIPDLGFCLVARDGTEVLGTDANFSIPDAQIKKGTNLLECQVSPDVLVPGTYTLRAGIFRAGILTYDYLESVLTFEILGSDFYAHDGRCKVFLPYEWSIRYE